MRRAGALGKQAALPAAMILCGALVALLGFLAQRRNDGHLIYLFDDAYIHMAMAKNFSLHGVWGVTPDGFTSASSSPLWTLILSAAYRFFGVGETAPLILNLLAAGLALASAYLFLGKQSDRLEIGMAGLALLVLAVPLPSLILTGMEHTLHVALAILFLSLAAGFLAADTRRTSREAAMLAMAPLLGAVRYEGLFLLAVVGVLLIFRRRMRAAVLLALLGTLPMLAYGAISIRAGWSFLPNSLLLKPASRLRFDSLDQVMEMLGKAAVRRLFHAHHFLGLFLASLALAVLLRRQRGQQVSSSIAWWANLAFMGATLLHLQFVGIGWTFRHEGYLAALGIVAIAGGAGECLRGAGSWPTARGRTLGLTAILIAGVLLSPLVRKTVPVLWRTPRAASNIYRQQYQMGRFVGRFYAGQSIALNDIGAVAFLADIHLLDLAGLASREVAALQLANRFDAAHVKSLTDARGTAIAIVYEDWFAGVDEAWLKAGEWKIPDNIICAGDTVSFWAVDPARRSELLANLRAFAPELPPEVRQSGAYRIPAPP